MFNVTKNTKIVIFSDNKISSVEKEIEDFLKENSGIIIHKILQNECCDNTDFFDFSITIFYEEPPK